MMHAVHGRASRAITYLFLALAFATLTCRPAEAQEGSGRALVGPARAAVTSRLATQVREIANSSALSRAKKEKRISNLVRVTVVAATAYKSDPDEVLSIAVSLATAAARAAPHFTEVIANAVSFAAPVARIDGAAGQIRTAAFAAARAPRPARRIPQAIVESEAPAPAAVEPSDNLAPPPDTRAVRRNSPSKRRAPPPEADEPMVATSDAPVVEMPTRRDPSLTAPAISLGDNMAADVTLDLGARRDSNIFSQPTNAKADTITSVTPGAEFRFGQNSLAHGSVGYQRAFTHYQNGSAPAVALSTGNATLGYDSASFKLNGGAALQQSNRSGNSLLANGRAEIFREDDLSGNLTAEEQITAKTSASVGGAYSRIQYQAAGLTNNKTISWPFNVYYEVTPKLDLSLGYTASKVTPETSGGATANSGPSSKDGYTNIGFRGSLTPKLSGNFSVGYRTRDVDGSPKEKLLGFDGSFNYDLTPKTAVVLGVTRNFSTGALGESIKGATYALKISSDPTTQWQTSVGFTYNTGDFGPQVFRLGGPAISSGRKDSIWSGVASATYLFSSWLSASADFNFTNSHSTIANATYADSIFGLRVGLRY